MSKDEFLRLGFILMENGFWKINLKYVNSHKNKGNTLREGKCGHAWVGPKGL